MNQYQKAAIAIAAAITMLVSSIGIAAYYEKVTLRGSVSLLIPEPTPTPSPTPSPSPSPSPTPDPTPADTSEYWIQVARDALRRATADKALSGDLTNQANQAMNGSQGTNAAYAALSSYWSMAVNEEQRAWVQEVNNQIGVFHQIAVNAHSAIAQTSGSINIWDTDKYVNGWQTAEYEYTQCKQTNDASGHLKKLKTHALNAKAQADAEDARIVTMQAQLAKGQKAASDAWQAIEALRLKLLAASQPKPLLPLQVTATPVATITPAPTEAPTPTPTATPTPAPTATPTPAPTATPTPAPTAAPTPEPTAAPTPEPTAAPAPKAAPEPAPASKEAPDAPTGGETPVTDD